MTLKNISGEKQYFSFGSRGYRLDPFEEITLPYSTPGLPAHAAKYVANGTMQVSVAPTVAELDPYNLNPELASAQGLYLWTPDGINYAERIGAFTFGPTGVETLIAQHTHALAGFYLVGEIFMITLAFPNLIDIDPENELQGPLIVQGASALTTLLAPVLSVVGGGIGIDGNPVLSTLDLHSLSAAGAGLSLTNNVSLTGALNLSALTTIIGNFSINAPIDELNLSALAQVSGNLAFNNTNIVELDFPSLTDVGNVNLSNNPLLTTVGFNTGTAINFSNDVILTSCALSSASVNAVLAALVIANGGGWMKTVDFGGGTSHAPTGQGITDAATLTGRGATVNTN